MRNVVIVGAGAMGCLFAARLTQAGAAVTLVDVDRDRLRKLNQAGVTLHDDDGQRTIAIRALLAEEMAGPVDLVMLFTHRSCRGGGSRCCRDGERDRSESRAHRS